jgi:hypothetical protein
VAAHDCDPPPAVSYAVIYNLNPELHDISFTNKYPIKSQISYQCLPGYTLQGNEIFACSLGGCWLPVDPPTCYRAPSNNYFRKCRNKFDPVSELSIFQRCSGGEQRQCRSGFRRYRSWGFGFVVGDLFDHGVQTPQALNQGRTDNPARAEIGSWRSRHPSSPSGSAGSNSIR